MNCCQYCRNLVCCGLIGVCCCPNPFFGISPISVSVSVLLGMVSVGVGDSIDVDIGVNIADISIGFGVVD